MKKLSTNEENVLQCINLMTGIALREQLIIVLEKVYALDAKSSSFAISGLKELKLVETTPAMPNCNPVMVIITRKGKSYLEGKPSKGLSKVIDTHANNLRKIFKMEQVIQLISLADPEIEIEYLFCHLIGSYLMMSKNDYRFMYQMFETKYSEIFHNPSVHDKKEFEKMFDYFNLSQMMSRDFYFGDISWEGNKLNVEIFYVSVQALNSEKFIKKFHKNVFYICYMLKRDFYRTKNVKLDLELKIKVLVFNKSETKYVTSKMDPESVKQRLNGLNELTTNDQLEFEVVNLGLDEKYKLKRPLI